MTTRRAWLLMAVGENRQHGGNDGCDDEPDTHYSWDRTVNNHAALKAGDAVALWDKKQLLGVSTIEEIETYRQRSRSGGVRPVALRGLRALPNQGCRCRLNLPASRRLRVM